MSRWLGIMSSTPSIVKLFVGKKNSENVTTFSSLDTNNIPLKYQSIAWHDDDDEGRGDLAAYNFVKCET